MKLDDTNVEYVSEILKALSTKERIISLETLSQGKISLKNLAKKTGMSRSGFQNIVDDLRNARLIEQTEHRSYYRLSTKGKKVLDLLNELSRQIAPLEKDIRREQLKASMAKFGSGLTEKDIIELFEELEKETNK
jgi:predicted transcriptional regulator